MPTENQQHQLVVTWPDADQYPVMATNAFAVQHNQHEFVINFGFAVPPPSATPSDLEKLQELPAKTIVRVSMSPTRLIELIDVFQQALVQYQQSQKH